MSRPEIDLDNTAACELAKSCAGCRTSDDLAVQTATTPVGVICLTLCESCTDDGKLPRFGMAEGVRMALDHCRHLGITADDMEAAMTPTRHTVRHYPRGGGQGSGDAGPKATRAGEDR